MGYFPTYAPDLCSAGFDVIEIEPGKKFTRRKGWQERGLTLSEISKWRKDRWMEYGVGVLSRNFPALDIDVLDEQVALALRDLALQVLGEAPERIGLPPKRLLVYCTRKPFEKISTPIFVDQKGAKHKIEFLATGQQFVAYADHPDTGEPYRWVGEELANLDPGRLTHVDHDAADAFMGKAAALIQQMRPNWTLQRGTGSVATKRGAARDPLATHKHKMGVSHATLEKALSSLDPQDYDVWFRCGAAVHHETGGSEHGFALWDSWSQNAVNYGNTRETWKSMGDYRGEPISAASLIHSAREAGADFTNSELQGIDDAADDEFAWPDAASRSKNGALHSNLQNVLIVLRHAPELRDAFEFDEMMQQVALAGPLPGVDFQGRRAIKDTDVTAVQEFLQRHDLKSVGKHVVHDAIDLRAQECSRHPVRKHLEAIEGDNKAWVENWLYRYLGAEDTPYTRAVGRMFLIAMVARVMEPGCKVDYCMVLEGPQGVGKSSVAKILGGDYFSDNLPDLSGDKDVVQHLNGKWLIEIAELSAFNKAEASKLKAFVTTAVDRYRPSYGRREVTRPRQCVFVGTTNDSAYLRDETGSRRFWPVRVGNHLDLNGLQRDRDQLLADALWRWRLGERWWPDAAFEREHIRPQQAARFQIDAWESEVQAWIAEHQPADATLSEIAHHALGITTPRLGTAEQNRLRAILTRLGWEQKPRGTKGRRPWGPLG